MAQRLGGVIADGPLWIDLDGAGPNPPVELLCDMTRDGGGWTLVAMTNLRADTYAEWLRKNVREDLLRGSKIPMNSWASVDAVALAVTGAREVRLSNSAIDRWVKWPMPPGRTVQTWWNHAGGGHTILLYPQTPVRGSRSQRPNASRSTNGSGRPASSMRFCTASTS